MFLDVTPGLTEDLNKQQRLGHIIVGIDAGLSRAPTGNGQCTFGRLWHSQFVCASWGIAAEKGGRIFMFSSSCSNGIHILKGKFRMKCIEILVACVLHLTGRVEGLWIISS